MEIGRQLTAREQRVLAHFVFHGEAKLVALQLGTSEHTIRNQLASIREKLGIPSLHLLAVLTTAALLLDDKPPSDSGNNYRQSQPPA
jgi:DNA-binding CsgD family transcriptional regulator